MTLLARVLLLASLANLAAVFIWPATREWIWPTLALVLASAAGMAVACWRLRQARRRTDASLAELRAALARQRPEVREAILARLPGFRRHVWEAERNARR